MRSCCFNGPPHKVGGSGHFFQGAGGGGQMLIVSWSLPPTFFMRLV